MPPQVPLHGTQVLQGTQVPQGPLQGPPPEGLRWKCSKLCCGGEKKRATAQAESSCEKLSREIFWNLPSGGQKILVFEGYVKGVFFERRRAGDLH